MQLSWYACDLVSGQIIEELQDLVPSGPISRVLGDVTSASFDLPIPLQGSAGSPPPNWIGATEPGRTMLVCVFGNFPIWAGAILTRVGGTAAMLQLGCSSLEGYLDRRFVTAHTWVSQDESSVIAAGLIADGNTTEGIDLTVDASATGMLRDRTYLATDDKSVFRALTELAEVQDGIEWTIDLDWGDSTHTWFEKIIRVRDRIGQAADVGGPNAIFETAASTFDTIGTADAVYSYSESYADGQGANHIIATSSGQGDIRPESSPARAENLFTIGWPRWELRYSPSTSITDTAILDAHAAARLAVVRDGARSITIRARADAYPMLGDHWSLGDDIGYQLIGHRHIDGFTGVTRVIGWKLDPQKMIIEPILVLPGEA